MMGLDYFESEKLELAEKTGDCLPWLRFCGADCCKWIFINKKDVGGMIKVFRGCFKVRVSLSGDWRHYYMVRGIRYERGFLYIPIKDLKSFGDMISVSNVCPQLTRENFCGCHDIKPKVCRLGYSSDFESDNMVMVEGCLFKYKELIKK